MLNVQTLNKDGSFAAVLGQETAKQGLRSALLSQRNVLIIGPPGIGKTTLAKEVALLLPPIEKDGKKQSGASRFIRVQGSPDLTVEDLIGDIDPIKALKFGPQSIEAFTPGKIFRADKGVLFFDEINRCPEKVQNALLQVLEEKKATIGSYKLDFDADFILIATMNPEDSSTEKLSDVFLDRFDCIYMGYPESLDIEKAIVLSKHHHDDIAMPGKLLDLAIGFVRLLRESPKLEKRPSVRASLGLVERAKANALLRGSSAADFDDLKSVVVSVIAHRIRLKPSHRFTTSLADFIEKEFSQHAEDYADEEEKGDGL
ncbi:MAG: MoxR family ATPase [DPANN group archaeon]|nr:MoxR family ATPase [DPANN group archaeon]